MLRLFIPELVTLIDLLSFEHPSILLFCFILIWSDFSPISWPWYQAWPSTEYEWFLWSICNGCGMRTRHLVPSLLVLAYAPIIETSFPKLAVSLLGFSPWISLGTISILFRRWSCFVSLKSVQRLQRSSWRYINRSEVRVGQSLSHNVCTYSIKLVQIITLTWLILQNTNTSVVKDYSIIYNEIWLVFAKVYLYFIIIVSSTLHWHWHANMMVPKWHDTTRCICQARSVCTTFAHLLR